MIPLPTAPIFSTGFPGLPDGAPSRRAGNVRAKAFRASLRRRAQLKAAADVLPHLPGPGESMHALMTGYYDLMLVITVIIQSRPVQCDHLRLVTLAFSKRNVQELCRLLDGKQIGRLTLLASNYMEKANAAVYQGAVEELAKARGQTIASARVHAKVSCLQFADGMKLVLESSANLRTNKNQETLTAINDAGLHDWHSAWLDAEVRAYELRTAND